MRTVAAIKRVKHTFCSRECTRKFHVGENSPLYRGDKDPNRGAAWNKLAASIRERDNYCCRRCGLCEWGQPDKLSVDHIRPWRSFKDKTEANHPDNLAALCRVCHSYKTTVIEKAWLRGDVIAWKQWVASLNLPSAARFGWPA
jgi:5-methylcytosine-specific restriction endonuclease McrA